MRDCVGVANSSSPSENSARHTFQDRAYLGGRIVRKRTKKSGIIYCLVTSHPPEGGVTNRPILGSQTPNSWSPAGRANSREFRLSRPRPQIPSKPGQFGA